MKKPIVADVFHGLVTVFQFRGYANMQIQVKTNRHMCIYRYIYTQTYIHVYMCIYIYG